MNTIKQQLKQAATYADLTPEAVLLLQNFFLKLASQKEKDELDKWLNEREANGHLFDLLLELNRDGTGAGVLGLLTSYTKRKPRKISRFRKFLWIGLLCTVVILLLDDVIPGHPLSRLIYGKPIRDVSTRKLTISSGDLSTMIWLSDSTLVELLPHSTLSYPEEFYFYERRVSLKGSARFEVRRLDREPFRVEGSQVWMTTADGDFVLRQENEGQKAVVESNRGSIIFGYDSKNSWAVNPGEKGLYADGKIELDRPGHP